MHELYNSLFVFGFNCHHYKLAAIANFFKTHVLSIWRVIWRYHIEPIAPLDISQGNCYRKKISYIKVIGHWVQIDSNGWLCKDFGGNKSEQW